MSTGDRITFALAWYSGPSERRMRLIATAPKRTSRTTIQPDRRATVFRVSMPSVLILAVRFGGGASDSCGEQHRDSTAPTPFGKRVGRSSPELEWNVSPDAAAAPGRARRH